MRAILIFANILLACIIAQGAIQWLNEPSVNAEVATTATKERRSSAPQPKNIQQQQTMPQRRQYASVTPDNQIATTVALNIFDPERAPKATVNNRRNATPVNRADMTLVGTFTIGDIAGAIILQRSQQMQQMRQQMGRNNNQNGNTNTAEELAAAQEQQMQQALENREELNTLRQALQQTEGVTEEQIARIQQRIDQSNQQIELLQNQNQQRNTGRDGLTADGAVATANASNSYKQYIRVGETLSNGYTLAAVTRTSATLTRGQEQPIELAMADASANAGRGGMGAMGGANRMGGMGGFGGGMGGGGMATIVGGTTDFGGGGFGGGGRGGAGGFGGGAGGFGGGGMGGGMDFGGGMGGGFGGGMGGGGMGGGAGGFGGGGRGGAGGFGGGAGGMGGGATATIGGGGNAGGGARTGGATTRAGGGTTTRAGGGAGGFGGGNAGGGRAGGMGGGRGGR